jgi:hypothetical protein
MSSWGKCVSVLGEYYEITDYVGGIFTYIGIYDDFSLVLRIYEASLIAHFL